MPNPLDTMHPLLYPPITAAPAHNWLVIAGLLAALLLLAGILVRRLRRPQQTASSDTRDLRQQALQELQQLTPPHSSQPAGAWLQQLNLLLKRLCSAHYPDYNSHVLTGRQWLAFLDSKCPAAGLSRWMVLASGSYQPECHMDEHAIKELGYAIETWISKHA